MPSLRFSTDQIQRKVAELGLVRLGEVITPQARNEAVRALAVEAGALPDPDDLPPFLTITTEIRHGDDVLSVTTTEVPIPQIPERPPAHDHHP